MTRRTLVLLLAAAAAVAVLAGHGPGTRVALRPHDRPGEADRAFYAQRLYPSGAVPAGWRDAALAQIRRMQTQQYRKPAVSWTWVPLGPTNVAGRIRALAMDPANPAVLYAGSAGGGVWKTTNAGAAWTPLTDALPNLRIGSIAVHPTEPGTVLAGNGEGFVLWQDALAYGRGILRTRDGGASWEVMPATQTAQFEFVFDIAFDPFTPDVLLAATKAGVMRSTDGGAQWSRLQLTFSQKRGMCSVFSRTTSGLVYAAVEGMGIYRSIDHGATWTGPLTSGITASSFTRIQLAAAPSNGDIIYAAFTADDESCAGMFVSSDRGEHWAVRGIPQDDVSFTNYMGEQGQYNSVLAVHPGDPATLWAGGINLYRSVDGGRNWTMVTNWFTLAGYEYVHADMHAFVYNPQNPSEAFVGCDGGVFRMRNGGTDFLDCNAGLVCAQFHSGTPHPVSDLVIGGTIDNGNLRVTSGSSWVDVTGGDGGYTAIDYNDPRTMYAELYYLEFMKSTQSGTPGSFTTAMSGIPRDMGGYGTSDRSGFISPFEMDPVNPRLLYAGTYRLYKTTNAAGSWSAISPDISGGGVLTAIGLARSTTQVIYAGASTSALYVTTDAGGTWTKRNTGFPNRYITDIALDGTDPAIAWVTVSGFGTGHVWNTTNDGASWIDASGGGAAGLPDAPANSIAIHPSKRQTLFAGTDAGMFVSEDGGATWAARNDGIGNVVVADVQFRRDGTLFITTHGRGAYRSSWSLLDTQRIPDESGFRITGQYPNPVRASAHAAVSVAFELGSSSDIAFEIHDAAGRLLQREDLGRRAPGSYQVPVALGRLSSGIAFLQPVVDGKRMEAVKLLLLR